MALEESRVTSRRTMIHMVADLAPPAPARGGPGGDDARPGGPYKKVKELHLRTNLVIDGRASAAIVAADAPAYARAATAVQAAIEAASGVRLPIVKDSAELISFAQNLIL